MRLKDKVAIVTGAGSGNGAAIAKGFLREGAKVVFADIDIKSAEREAKNSGYDQELWQAVEVDVSKKDSVNNLVVHTLEVFSSLDIMVANAGITIRKPFLELTEEDYDRVMDVNAKGYSYAAKKLHE